MRHAPFSGAHAGGLGDRIDQAGVHGMTKGVHQSLKTCLAEPHGVAVRPREDGVIPHDVAMELRAHAIAELDETTARLGLRGAKP